MVGGFEGSDFGVIYFFGSYFPVVVKEYPVDGGKEVQGDGVNVLESMKPEATLVGTKSEERILGDIII